MAVNSLLIEKVVDAGWISGRGEQEGRRTGRKKKHQHYSLKKSRDFALSLVYLLKSEISDQATSDTWEMEGSSVQNYKKTNPPAPTTGVGGGNFLKQALDGLHPQGAWSHQRMTSLAPTFLFVFIHLLATNSLLPPRTSLSPRGVLTIPTLFLLNMEGGDTHKEETDRQTGGGGVVLRTTTIRPKVSPARTLGPGRVGIMYKWQMQATSSHLCEPNFPEPISYILLSIIRWSMCQSVLHQKITRPSDLVK